MNESTGPVRVPSSTDGRGLIGRDSRIGQVVNAVVTATGLGLVEALGDLDFSTAPRAIAALAPVAVGLISGWITTKLSRSR